MLKQIQQTIKKHRLLLPGQHVLVAVSGGADSVAMLCALRELAPSLGISLTVAHLNHCIRGKASDEDAAFVRKLAGRLKVSFVQGRSDVPRRARRKGLSLEMAAREARYAFLAKTARKIRADAVATAHTADDQAETVLLKLARGAGPRGLGGIPRETVLGGVKVVRPMLDVTRNEIVAFLRRKQVAWREDESNRDVSFLRNRIRHEVLPLLESRLNPKVRCALLRTAEIIHDEDIWLDDLATSILAECQTGSAEDRSSFIPGRRAVPRAGIHHSPLLNHPAAARRRVLRLWLASSGVPAELIDFDTVGRIEALLRRTKGSGQTSIAGKWTVKRRYERLLIEEGNGLNPTTELLGRHEPSARAGGAGRTAKEFREIVKIPGETVLADSGLRVLTLLEPGLVKGRTVRAGMLPARASIRYSAVERRKVFVRSWRPGDRMRPLGLNGSKKLQDIFVDEKVPVEQRGGVPLFECGGRIIWLPGYRVAQGWEVKDPTASALQAYVERI